MNAPAGQTDRNRARERGFLDRAAGFSGPSEFVAHCQQRLEQGEREFGDRWSSLDLLAFAKELREEAADLGAWAALAEQSPQLAAYPEPIRAVLASILEQIARRGAQAHFEADAFTGLVKQEAET